MHIKEEKLSKKDLMAVQIHHAPRHITTLKPAQTLDLIKTAATFYIPE